MVMSLLLRPDNSDQTSVPKNLTTLTHHS